MHNRIILNANNDNNQQSKPQQNNQARISPQNTPTLSTRDNQTNSNNHDFKFTNDSEIMNAPQISVCATNYSAVDSHNIILQKHNHNGWGTANLTLYSDGLLYLSDGTLNNYLTSYGKHGTQSDYYNQDSLIQHTPIYKILGNYIDEVTSIRTRNVKAPRVSADLFQMSHFINTTHFNKKLNSIDFSGGFDTSNVSDMYGMFSGDQSLNHLDLGSHFDTSKVTNMSAMFSGTRFKTIGFSKLDDLDLGSLLNTNSCKYFGKMDDFDFTLGDNGHIYPFPVTKTLRYNTNYIAGMFGNNPNLQYVDLSNLSNYVDASWLLKGGGITIYLMLI